MRILVILAIAIVPIFVIVSDAAAQATAPRVVVDWTPRTVSGATLAGTCPTQHDPRAPCPIERGVTYRITVHMQVDSAVDGLIFSTQGGGMELTAVSGTTNADYTRPLAAGAVEPVNISVTIPDASGRNDRSFFLGRVTLSGPAKVVGSLTINVAVPSPKVSWGRPIDPTNPDKTGLVAYLGSGDTVSRTLSISSNIDVPRFNVQTSSDGASVSGIPGALVGGQDQQLTVGYRAPLVTRRTTTDIKLQAMTGLVALQKTMRLRVVVFPAEISWSPPILRETLVVQNQKATTIQISFKSNYDIPGVRFSTADLGLTPILSPLVPVDLRAGVPQAMTLRMCPGYAPTTYFLGITAFQGNKPINRRLQIRLNVEDDGSGLPVAPPVDACSQT